MGFLFLLIFIVVPLIEIALFIQIGGLIGLWPTLALILLTAVLGVGLLRLQGFATLQRARASMDRREPPVREVFEGLLLFVAGAFLLTPGFFTDACGFLLLVPPLRGLAVDWLLARMIVAADMSGPGGPGPGRRPADPTVIDGDYTEVRPGEESGRDDSGRDGDGNPWIGGGRG
jgi:UPF0716 protein FxsA